LQASQPKRSFTPFFRVIKNTKTVRGAEQMIRYIAFRSRDLEGQEKGAFGPDTDHAHIKRFVQDLPDRLTRHPQAVKAFHTVFSLSREEWNRLGLTDWRPIVREVMQAYERESGRKLTWIAAQHHNNPTHPHCHVVIKAVYENEDGQRRKLFLRRQDLARFKEIMSRTLRPYRDQARILEQEASSRPRFRIEPKDMRSIAEGIRRWFAHMEYQQRLAERRHLEWLWLEEEERREKERWER
jgi:hypothetical protein